MVISPHFDPNLFSIVFEQDNRIMDATAAATETEDITYTTNFLAAAAQSDADVTTTAVSALQMLVLISSRSLCLRCSFQGQCHYP